MLPLTLLKADFARLAKFCINLQCREVFFCFFEMRVRYKVNQPAYRCEQPEFMPQLGIGLKIKYLDKTVAGAVGSRGGGMLFKRNSLSATINLLN